MAAKDRTKIFFCKECGNEYSKWMGQCPACGAWNSFEEGLSAPKTKRGGGGGITGRMKSVRPVPLSTVTPATHGRISTGMNELDRVLGGGIVPGSMVLVGGDPGIGKSTLLLQMCRNLCAAGRRLLYVSGEESAEQIKMRADRMGQFTDSLLVLSETDLGLVQSALEQETAPVDAVVIDSIQTMTAEHVDAAPGSISQVREATSQLLRIAKEQNISIFIVGHVTKEGVVAGPRMLEHMVDTVLYFEGDRHASYRVLRAVKNRFGSTNEIGVFEMVQEGLAEVPNPSEYMLSGRPDEASGSVVTCAMEGTRPVLLEVQALVCSSAFPNPRRTAAGFDFNRLNLLAAVLEKRLGLYLGKSDIYLNIAGGMRLSEPGLDLAVALAVISSYQDITISPNVIAFGEIGLSGEVRAVSQAQQRVTEAARLGFQKVILPAVSLQALPKNETAGIKCVGVANLGQAFDAIR